MNREELIRLLMATYLEEFEGLTAAWSRDALALEDARQDDVRAQLLRDLLRTAHSLKGASRSVDVGLVEQACHHLEELLGRLSRGEAPLSPEVSAFLVQAGDRLNSARVVLAAGLVLQGGALERWLSAVDWSAPHLIASATRSVVEEAVASPAGPDGGDSTRFLRVSADRLDGLAFRVTGLSLIRQRLVEDLEQVTAIAAMLEPVDRGRFVPRASDVASSAGATAETRKAVQRLERAFGEHLRELDQQFFHLQGEVERLRLVRFGEACDGLVRMVRDLGRELDKEVALEVVGGEIEIDRTVATALRNSLRHLVRNAVGHGLETPAERESRGKLRRGVVRIRLSLHGGQCEIEVSDDGRGIDAREVAERARRANVAVPASAEEVASLIFHPGLSTAAEVTALQGRGMGLDIVRAEVERLHGTIDVASPPSGGAVFRIAVPLSASSIRAVLVSSGRQAIAVPFPQVERVLRVDPAAMREVDGRRVAQIDGRALEIVSLARVLGLGEPPPSFTGGALSVVVVKADAHRLGVTVDGLAGEQDIVVKGLGPRLKRVRHFNGATVMPDGHIVLILQAADVIRTVLEWGQSGQPGGGWEPPPQSAHLLIVDDSVTTRAVVRMLLEAAGYQVTTAVDGEEAWRLLQRMEVEAVISDVEMPRMDGLALTRTIRASERHRHIPVVLVTGLANDEDRSKGLDAGADAYLVKATFDQTALLAALRRLL